MLPVRILFGDLSTGVNCALSAAIRSQCDMAVVGVAHKPTELLLAAGARQADVLVVGMVGRELPGVASHLLDQYPHVTVLAIAPDGRQALMHTLRPHTERIHVSSMAELVRAIQVARQPQD